MRLEITKIKISRLNGSAVAQVVSRTSENALNQEITLILQAKFVISDLDAVSGYQFCYHIPGSMHPRPLFAHVSITTRQTESDLKRIFGALSPPLVECHETFAIGIAHVLTYTTQTIHRYNLDEH